MTSLTTTGKKVFDYKPKSPNPTTLDPPSNPDQFDQSARSQISKPKASTPKQQNVKSDTQGLNSKTTKRQIRHPRPQLQNNKTSNSTPKAPTPKQQKRQKLKTPTPKHRASPQNCPT
jgi:hypothetical protein